MPETASPDPDMPISDPQANKTSIAARELHENYVQNSSTAPDDDPDKVETDARSRGNATKYTNGHVPKPVNGHRHDIEDETLRPTKRRRTRESTPPSAPLLVRKSKPISPPWKKIEAEGPTTFQENGRRKSSRINTLPLDLQPPSTKRLTRRSLTFRNLDAPAKNSPPSLRGTPNNRVSIAKPPTPKSAPQRFTRPPPASAAIATTPKTSSDATARTSPRLLRRSVPSPASVPTRHSTRTRRSSRLGDSSGHQDDFLPSSNAKSMFNDTSGTRSSRTLSRAVGSGIIPLVHPDQVRKRPKIGSSFEDYWSKAEGLVVEEGGLHASEDGLQFSDDIASKDALVIQRIEAEVEPGGILSASKCSLFAPGPTEEPTKQWAHHDHMAKAMVNLRKLILAEQQRHRAAAKKMAEACRDAWLRRQPKSAEQLEVEARENWISCYRTVVRAVSGTWDNVRAQVNRQRLEQWEAEEQKRVKAALNEAVNLSEQKLQARRLELDSDDDDGEDVDDGSDDGENGDGFDEFSDIAMTSGDRSVEAASSSEASDDSEKDLDSDNMSTSDEDDDEAASDDNKQIAADEALTQEELSAKYADLPDLTVTAESAITGTLDANGPEVNFADEGDTSDTSVDMNDDLGSTENGGDNGDEDQLAEYNEVTSNESADEDAAGLLGLFFGKSELRQMKREIPVHSSSVEQGTDGRLRHAGANSLRDRKQHATQDNDIAEETNISRADRDSIIESGAEILTNGHDNTKEARSNKSSFCLGSDEAQAAAEANGSRIADEVVANAELEVVMSCEIVADTAMVGSEYASPKLSPGPNGHRVDGQAIVQSEAATNTPLTQASELSTASEMKNKHLRPDITTSSAPTTTNESDGRSISPNAPSVHKTEIPFLLRGTLREYQHDGLDWLAGLYANKTNGILADEMGLGKTIQTIALLAHLACYQQVWGPHLVIVPTSVMLNWEMEFKKWCPGFKILAYYGSQEERKRKRQGWNNDDIWNVCITSYQLVLQDQQVFKRRRWHFMVLDEAHNIKNFKSQRWQTLLGFNTQARLLLTGTPLQNNLTELWSLLFFLMPAENGVGGFADLQEFQDWFHKPESQILESGRDQMDEEAKAIISKLHKVLRPYLLRRLKADVEKQMPAKYEHVEFCRLSKRQRELYDGFLSRTDTKETLSSGNYLSIINCLMQLRKVCNHPDLFIDRPIMTSFRMSKSVAAEYGFVEQRLRALLADGPMAVVNLNFLNLVPTDHEQMSSVHAERVAQLSSHRALMDLRETQKGRAQAAYTLLDPATVKSSIAYLESGARWGRFEELQHIVYLNALRRQRRPIYGKNIVDLVSIDAYKRPFRPKPKVPSKVLSWIANDLAAVRALTPTLAQRATSLKTTITKFSCVTPAVVTRDLHEVLLSQRAAQAFTDEDLRLSAPVRWAPFLPKEQPIDPWHESRMRHSIQFPDKRLLQFDCGKLQVLDRLLRKLQTGGHRALIFTQMTKVLDILEQFLNIHGHKYLRLDGATKVEQRQILTDRFNNDPRILCFILSTRSGGLGINLTGADTVIFYDQDWNPAMDKQCQDRCHRIGQTRDVHIYRLVSEHTIEANILRKASQKQMLDDVVIQEGEFTTDYFNRVSVRDVLETNVDYADEGVAAADAALDRVLGGPDTSRDQRTVGRAFEQAEDREDVAAARVAEREIAADDEDFTEKTSGPASGAVTARQGTPAGNFVSQIGLDAGEMAQIEGGEAEHNAWGQPMGNIDQHMLKTMTEELQYTKLELPKDRKKGKKKGRDTRKR